MAIEPSGKIDVAGFGSAAHNMLVTRLTSVGNLDPSLNGRNTADADFGGADTASAVVLQPNGKIVLGGFDDHDFALVRFQPGGLPDTTFGAGRQAHRELSSGGRGGAVDGPPSRRQARACRPRRPLTGSRAASRGTRRRRAAAAGGGGGGGGGSGNNSSRVPRCAGHLATIVGTFRSDRLKGTRRADVIVALGGNDSVDGGGGNDIICGGAGNDSVKGGSGSDKIYGEAGKDKLSGGAGNDKMSGGAGNDTLSGGAGKDAINGGSGKDKDNGGSGKDSCAGKDSERSC